MTKHIAAQVKRLREAQRMPITQLSERMGELGKPIARLGISDLEKGKRKVDVDELVALAKALGVPPLLLILPVGSEPETEVLPGIVRDTWDAAQWFTGEAPFTRNDSQDFNEWALGARPLDMAREHERLLMNWRMELSHATGDMAAVAEAQPESALALAAILDESIKEARAFEKALLDHRRAMAARGFVLPRVPELDPENRRRLAAHGLPQPAPDTVAAERRSPVLFKSEADADERREGSRD